MTDPSFPTELLLDEPGRRQRLLRAYYEGHHARCRDLAVVKDAERKIAFFKRKLAERGETVGLGLDVGCRGGALTKHLQQFGRWVGVDVDANAVRLAAANGVPCIELDVSLSVGFKDGSFDAVCATEVLEHLPYPALTVGEVHRILRRQPTSIFIGSVPIDYHLHRRFAVLRGRRLTCDPTHLHSFAFQELKDLLEHYFETVEFEPLRGTKRRHRWLSWHLFVRDVAWFAAGPRREVSRVRPPPESTHQDGVSSCRAGRPAPDRNEGETGWHVAGRSAGRSSAAVVPASPSSGSDTAPTAARNASSAISFRCLKTGPTTSRCLAGSGKPVRADPSWSAIRRGSAASCATGDLRWPSAGNCGGARSTWSNRPSGSPAAISTAPATASTARGSTSAAAPSRFPPAGFRHGAPITPT